MDLYMFIIYIKAGWRWKNVWLQKRIAYGIQNQRWY